MCACVQKEMHFDESLVRKQLRYTGMLETVRMRKSGYGAKYTFKVGYCVTSGKPGPRAPRYAVLLTET